MNLHNALRKLRPLLGALVLVVGSFSAAPPAVALAGGGGWTHVGPNSDMDSLAIDPRDDQVLYGSGPSGVWKSSDGGNTWTQLTSTKVGALAVSPFVSTTLFSSGATSNGNHGARSLDGGVTWTSLTTPIGGQGGTNVVLPDPNLQNAVFAGGTDSTGSAAVWRSLDNGATWTTISAPNLGQGGLGIPAILHLGMVTGGLSPVLVAAVLSYHSSWEIETSAAETAVPPTWTTIAGQGPILWAPVRSSVGIAGHSQNFALYGYPGFWRSDTGQAWVDESNKLPSGLAIAAMALNPQQPDWVYASFVDAATQTMPSGVYASPDRGQTWLAVDFPGLALTLVPNNLVINVTKHTLFAATAAGIYRKTVVWLPGTDFAAFYNTMDGVRLLGGGLSPQGSTTGLPIQYFEKGRIEDHLAQNPPANWRYMYGLLVDQLQQAHSLLPIGGNTSTLNYSQLAALADPGQRVAPPPQYPGNGVFVFANGSAFVPFSATLQGANGHVVDSRFWAYINRTDLFPGGWLHDVGLPISEVVTVTVTKNLPTGPVNRVIQVQGFQRTILTYDPLNPPGWTVERANVGTDYRMQFPMEVGP